MPRSTSRCGCSTYSARDKREGGHGDAGQNSPRIRVSILNPDYLFSGIDEYRVTGSALRRARMREVGLYLNGVDLVNAFKESLG